MGLLDKASSLTSAKPRREGLLAISEKKKLR